MCRALFIFAKLNPGLTYVQGMNELYAPLYYLCRHDSGAGRRTMQVRVRCAKLCWAWQRLLPS